MVDPLLLSLSLSQTHTHTLTHSHTLTHYSHYFPLSLSFYLSLYEIHNNTLPLILPLSLFTSYLGMKQQRWTKEKQNFEKEFL